MDFGYALNALREGKRVTRPGWNGKGMFLLYVPSEEWTLSCGAWSDEFAGMERGQFILMKTADNKIVPWLASQTDILAEDWMIAT